MTDILIALGAMVGFPVFFIGIGAFAIFITSVVSGWRGLALHYRCDPPDTLQWKHCFSAAIGYPPFRSSYRNVLRFAVDAQAVYIRPIWLISLGHPPLKIPFSEAVGKPAKGLIGRVYHIETNAMPKHRITVKASLGEWIEAEAKRAQKEP